MELRKILVPSDCSERSAAAIEEALWLAQLAGAAVDLLHLAPHAADYYPLDE